MSTLQHLSVHAYAQRLGQNDVVVGDRVLLRHKRLGVGEMSRKVGWLRMGHRCEETSTLAKSRSLISTRARPGHVSGWVWSYA